MSVTLQAENKNIMIKRIIFYFSATGNSLYVANQLKGGDGEALSIPQLMKNKEFDFEAEEIGFVYPIYAHTAIYGTAVHSEGSP